MNQFKIGARSTRDYVQPPKDFTPVKCQIVRGCWMRLDSGEPAVRVLPEQIIQIPRWLADELAGNGKASLL